jgi:hypothetical protein
MLSLSPHSCDLSTVHSLLLFSFKDMEKSDETHRIIAFLRGPAPSGPPSSAYPTASPCASTPKPALSMREAGGPSNDNYQRGLGRAASIVSWTQDGHVIHHELRVSSELYYRKDPSRISYIPLSNPLEERPTTLAFGLLEWLHLTLPAYNTGMFNNNAVVIVVHVLVTVHLSPSHSLASNLA